MARYALASQHVPNVPDRNRKMEEHTSIFRAYTRNVRRAALTRNAQGDYDALARKIVAGLVAGELERKDTADQSQLIEMDFGFQRRLYAPLEAEAWGHIAALRSGDAVFDEDPALRDTVFPDPVALEANTGTGEIFAKLPYGYKGTTPGNYRIKCTTAGRVDAASARFSIFYQGNATPLASAVVPTADWLHVQNELYIMFRDPLTSGTSFQLDDEWVLQVFPPDTSARGRGMRRMEIFTS